MPADHPPITTLAVMKEIQGSILQDYTVSCCLQTTCADTDEDQWKEPGEHLSVIVFAAGHDAPEIVTTPYVNGSLSVTRWL